MTDSDRVWQTPPARSANPPPPFGTLMAEVSAELFRAERKFPPFHSAHEGYAVLLEEVEELKDEVFHGSALLARKEAIQVAAMALRLIKDCYS